MKSEDPSLTDLLNVARDFVEHERFDAEAAVELLDVLAAEEIDVQTSGAVRHAKRTALLACHGSGTQTTIARYALSRVIMLLEGRAVAAAPVNGFGTMSRSD